MANCKLFWIHDTRRHSHHFSRCDFSPNPSFATGEGFLCKQLKIRVTCQKVCTMALIQRGFGWTTQRRKDAKKNEMKRISPLLFLRLGACPKCFVTKALRSLRTGFEGGALVSCHFYCRSLLGLLGNGFRPHGITADSRRAYAYVDAAREAALTLLGYFPFFGRSAALRPSELTIRGASVKGQAS